MLHRLLGLSKAVAAVTACVVMTLCIQYVPFGVEAFYWWNGSVGYTGLFSVMLILFGMLADSLRRGKISVRRMTALLALELLLAGGMYPTALLTAVVLFLVMVDGLAGKKYGRNLKIQLTVLFLLYLPEFGHEKQCRGGKMTGMFAGNDIYYPYASDGAVNIDGLLRRLEKDGYTGFCTMEPHTTPEKCLDFYREETAYLRERGIKE